MQRLRNSDETQWRCRILPNRVIISAKNSADSGVVLKLDLPENRRAEEDQHYEEDLEVDYVFTATGYRRNAHEDILSNIRELLPSGYAKEGNFPVARDYRVQWDENKVDAREAGVWLQGCNEGTHGVIFG
jgi:L-ornithine N5-oxygenase